MYRLSIRLPDSTFATAEAADEAAIETVLDTLECSCDFVCTSYFECQLNGGGCYRCTMGAKVVYDESGGFHPGGVDGAIDILKDAAGCKVTITQMPV